jgi:hypothetical protein
MPSGIENERTSMKLMMRNWQWLVVFLAAGLICVTYLLAQTQTAQTGVDTQAVTTAAVKVAPPDAVEAADSVRLIKAVNGGDAETALEILHTYGVAENTLLAMAARLGKPPTNAVLKEPFLKASVAALALTDRMVKTNVQAALSDAIVTLDYGRPVWMPRRPNTQAMTSYDADLAQCPTAPIMVLNVRLDDPCLIRYFKLYDRYAEQLHSVVLNGPNLNNTKLDATNYDLANRNLNALFQLIKARKPDAFVWLGVVKEDDHSDEQWLKAMTFMPDGLQISNLRQFHSPFAETRARYMEIVGTNMPMMVTGFYGYAAALQEKRDILTAAMKSGDLQAEATATAQLGGIGAVVGQGLKQVETNLQSLGYRGISVQWSLLMALATSGQAAVVDKSDLIDPHVALLDTYYGQGDYAHVLSLAADLISNSNPGDMNWMVGKLYEGIALLSQTPPKTNDAIAVLDEILAINFQNRPGRDHYILGAVKWRIQAAFLSGDMEKPRELVQWVQNQNFRTDLKSAFLKKYGVLLNLTPATSK